MDHVAILRKAKIKKDDNLLQAILDGKKTIESRWYVNKIAPWNKIHAGDTVYFKESGCLISAKAHVTKVLQYENLNPAMVNDIIASYGQYIAPDTSIADFHNWAAGQLHKKYCILVFLAKVEKLTPFAIDKTGFGMSSAWMVVDDVNTMKKSL